MDNFALSKWKTDAAIGAQRVAGVVHEETGQRGYRAVAWNNGRVTLYGPVYSGPNCTSADECRELGIPETEADSVLCR